MICGQCREKTCFTHQIRWHDGFTCRQHDCHEDADHIDLTGEDPVDTSQVREDRKLAESPQREQEAELQRERNAQDQRRWQQEWQAWHEKEENKKKAQVEADR